MRLLQVLQLAGEEIFLTRPVAPRNGAFMGIGTGIVPEVWIVWVPGCCAVVVLLSCCLVVVWWCGGVYPFYNWLKSSQLGISVGKVVVSRV